MKSIGNKILAVVLTVMFVNFVFSNTVYTHSHIDYSGKLVTHSHPYLPSSGHTHNQAGLDQIANFNLSSGAFVAASAPSLIHFNKPLRPVYFYETQRIVKRCPDENSLRAPPFLIS